MNVLPPLVVVGGGYFIFGNDDKNPLSRWGLQGGIVGEMGLEGCYEEICRLDSCA